MTIEEDIAGLEHCRSILVRMTGGLTTEQIDFQLFEDSKTIGELLLHVAGFEFLLVSAACLDEREPDIRLWQSLKAGFSREAGFPPPRGHALDHYMDRLGTVRSATIARLRSRAAGAAADGQTFPIRRLAETLAMQDPERESDAYDRLAKGVGTSFADDGSVSRDGTVNLLHTMQLHETYHRGQITLQKYVHSRHTRSAAARTAPSMAG